jgi:MFS family permease
MSCNADATDATDATAALPDAQPAPAWRDLFAGRSAVYSIALGGSVGLHAVNIYVASTIMPSAVEDIGGLDYYAWSTTLFVLASILGSALSARLLQAAGARAAYGIAAIIFAGGTLVCALAPSMPVLLVGRFVQGFGGGFLYALAYGVMRLIFGAWRAAFWSLIPVAALFALMAVLALPGREAHAQEPRPLPLPQLLLLSAAVLLLSVGSIGHDLLWNLLSVGGTVAALALLVALESRSAVRLLPTGALAVAAPLGALYATIALLMVGMQPGLFVPYLLQRLHGQPPLVAGYLSALLALGWTLGSMGSATWRTGGARRGILSGPVLCLFGLGLLAFVLPVHGDGAWLVLLPACLALVSVGLGIGLTWPHLVTQVFKRAPAAEHDLAAAAITTVQLSAAALGAALAGMVANLAGLSQPGGIAGASSAAAWLFGLVALAPLLCMMTALRVAQPADSWR